jgi:fibronectin-binding autotransporter adhesin
MPSFAPKRHSQRVRVNAIWLMNAATLALTIAGVVKSSTFEAKAGSYFWAGQGSTGTSNWGTSNEWWLGSSAGSNGTFDVTATAAGGSATDLLYFGNVGTNATTLSTSNQSAQLITFNSGASSYTLQANNNYRKIAMNGNIVNNTGSGTQTFNITLLNNITSNGTMVINTASGGTTTIAGRSGASFTLGSVTLQQAISMFGSSTSRGGTVEIAGAGTTNITGTIDNEIRFVGNNTSVITANNSTNGILKITSTGLTTLSGANTYVGKTQISNGTVQVGNATAFGGNYYMSSGTPANGTSPGSATGGTQVGYGTVTLTSGAIDMNGTTMTGLNALTISGTGVSSSGAIYNSSGTGATYAGSVTLGTNASIAQIGSGALTLSGGLALGSYSATIGAGTNANVTVSGALSGSGTLTKTGAGTLFLSGDNTYTGAINLNAGKLDLGGLSGTALSVSNSVTFGSSSNGTLSLSGRSTTVGLLSGDSTATIENNNATLATLTASVSSNQSFAGKLQDGTTGTLSFTKAGTGTLTLSGASTYTGCLLYTSPSPRD